MSKQLSPWLPSCAVRQAWASSCPLSILMSSRHPHRRHADDITLHLQSRHNLYGIECLSADLLPGLRLETGHSQVKGNDAWRGRLSGHRRSHWNPRCLGNTSIKHSLHSHQSCSLLSLWLHQWQGSSHETQQSNLCPAVGPRRHEADTMVFLQAKVISRFAVPVKLAWKDFARSHSGRSAQWLQNHSHTGSRIVDLLGCKVRILFFTRRIQALDAARHVR